MLRRFHYDAAFERWLRQRRVPYIGVDEAKRALAPVTPEGEAGVTPRGEAGGGLKSFDFVVYRPGPTHLLVEVKGRKLGASRTYPNWSTRGDVTCLMRWRELFGSGFEAVFVFLYWCEREPAGVLFQDLFEAGGRWYQPLAVRVSDYAKRMRPRSAKWDTVHLPAADFREMAVPLRRLFPLSFQLVKPPIPVPCAPRPYPSHALVQRHAQPAAHLLPHEGQPRAERAGLAQAMGV